MRKIVFCLLIILSLSSNSYSSIANSNESNLPECVIKTHCIRIDWKTNDASKSFQQTKRILTQLNRANIIQEEDGYLHAEVTSKLIHFIDDLEIKRITQANVIQIRSESRVGIYDMGVNKKRVESLMNSLEAYEGSSTHAKLP